MLIKGYKLRIYPNKDQKDLLEKHINCCLFIYNKLLHIKQTLYEKFKMSISEFEFNNHLTVLKEQKESHSTISDSSTLSST